MSEGVITGIVTSRRALWTTLVGVLGVVALSSVGPGAATRAKGPRIVSAVMLDVDGDAKADGVRLRYSVPIRHARDLDGHYPFAVAGYRVVGVAAAAGTFVTIVLAEKAKSDGAARPTVRYRPTKAQPVRDRTGRQAVAQLYAKTRPHGHRPAKPPVVPAPPPPDTDPDKDGYAAPADCRPDDPAINPGATDRPDLSFVDTNCDGIDGDESKSIFVAPNGDDANPGTRQAPKRQIQAAVAALGARRDILVAGGAYGRVELVLQPAGIGIFGGYGGQDWTRSAANATRIIGEREGVLVAATREVVLQYLTIGATAVGPGGSTYGIRAFSPTRNATDTTLALRGVEVIAGPGTAGIAGVDGLNGLRGVYGGPGLSGQCDGSKPGAGGVGGVSAIGRAGGNGGRGGAQGIHSGDNGGGGQIGTPGGTGGSSVELAGYAGKPGGKGKDGVAGRQGVGGGIPDVLGQVWAGGNGTDGAAGTHGMGGGGGGGGGGQGGELVFDGSGNGGGGGGAGGRAGTGGSGGTAGGNSIGLYLYVATVTFDGGSLESSGGGAGGQGGRGGTGGAGGLGGLGATYCSREIGEGGNGGAGGRGGDGAGGGGGAGGSSIGIVQIGSKVTLRDVTIDVAAGGAGGGTTGIAPLSPTRGATGITKAVYEASPA